MSKTILIKTFVNQCQHNCFGIQLIDKVSNKDLWVRTNLVQIGFDKEAELATTGEDRPGQDTLDISC